MKNLILILVLLFLLVGCASNDQSMDDNMNKQNDMDNDMQDDNKDDMKDDVKENDVVDEVMNDGRDNDDEVDNQGSDVPSDETDSEAKVEEITLFEITGENFAFFMNGEKAPELKVKVGDRVRIEFTSTEGFHDWVVDEFNAATDKVQAGSSTFVEFIVDKAGIFEYYCSVGSHRLNGMYGNLIVEE